MPTSAADTTDLVVLSPVRWTATRGRPQHLVTRLAARRAAAGGRAWYVEPPVATSVAAPRLATAEAGPVTRVWLETPPDAHDGDDDAGSDAGPDLGSDAFRFDTPAAAAYTELLRTLLRGRDQPRDVWLFTPTALDLGIALRPRLLLYDVLDDHTAPVDAGTTVSLAHRRALAEAHLVTTAGRTLHRGVLTHRSEDVHLLGGGVEHAHFATARVRHPDREHAVAGYVGPVDARLDLGLLAALADGMPEWRLVLVGPVSPHDADRLPRRDNLEYVGDLPYDALPRTMSGFDVALLPYALTGATRALSPTVALEYLAAGLPVVSTRVPDIVTELTGIVSFADDAEGFARACTQAVVAPADVRDRRVEPLRIRLEWDALVDDLERLVSDAVDRVPGAQRRAASSVAPRPTSRHRTTAAAAAAAAWRGVTGGPAGRGIRG